MNKTQTGDKREKQQERGPGAFSEMSKQGTARETKGQEENPIEQAAANKGKGDTETEREGDSRQKMGRKKADEPVHPNISRFEHSFFKKSLQQGLDQVQMALNDPLLLLDTSESCQSRILT